MAETADAADETGVAAPHAAPLPWLERLYAATPLPPFVLGAGLALGWLGLAFVLAAASGALAQLTVEGASPLTVRDARLALLVSLLAGYLPTACFYASRGARRTEERLAAVLPRGALPSEPPARDRRGRWLAIGIGALLVPLIALLIDRDPGLYFRAYYWRVEAVWNGVVGGFVCGTGGLLSYITLDASRRLSDAAEHLAEPLLLDPRVVAGFARQGLLFSLLWVIFFSVFALNLVDRAFAPAIGLLALMTLGIAGAGLLLPSRGVHRRIREAKLAELARVNAALRGEPDALRGSPLAGRERAPEIVDLLAWRSFVAELREWPFDAATLRRFGLYLLIPLLSWIGGALVERGVDTLLD